MAKLSKVGVVGAGNMGSGIAQKFAQEGIPVVMVDIREEFVQRGLETIRGLLEQAVERKIFRPDQMEAILSRITGATDRKMLADADLVVEAVFEDREVKSELFRELDAVCSDRTVLATNTSSFTVEEFALQTRRPDRFVGLHYFYHPAKNRLLEIIPHAGTSEETMDFCKLAAKLHGKTAIRVADAPGFAVNRFFVPFLNEAGRMLEEKVADIPTIEAAAKKAFRIGMGPFELMNVTGVPITAHATRALAEKLGPFYDTADIIARQVEKKENWDLSGDPDESLFAPVMDRLYGVTLGVAAALVDETVATREDTDRGAKIGLRWAQGPFEIMNRIGIEETCRVVQAIADRYADFSFPEGLRKQREAGKPFTFNWVDLAIRNGIATITVNRPEAMNALNEEVVEQLDRRFTEAENHPDVRAVVFRGAGKAFVAGADIRFFVKNIQAGDVDRNVAFARRGHEVLLRIEDSAKPTIAVLDGLSLGGGSEMALACQAIVATDAGSMGFPESGIGIYPGLGGMLRLSRQVGPELARYYVFTGAPINAQEAEALGIVHRRVGPEAVDAAVSELAAAPPDKYRKRDIPQSFAPFAQAFTTKNVQRLLTGKPPEGVDEKIAARISKTVGYKSPLALRMTDEIITAQQDRSIPEGVEIELGRLAECFGSEDALEGLTSLGRKRPEFKGR